MKLAKEERVALVILWGAVLLFGCLLVAASWPRYWTYVAAETTPLAWLEGVLLLLSGFTAALLAFEAYTRGAARKIAGGWAVVAAAFCWLGLDERFAVHERLRDKLLKPTGVKLLPWMEAGDWLIPLYAVCGLAATWGIWRLLASTAAGRVFFAFGVVVAAIAVGMDTIDVRSLDKGMERLLQSVEEGLETVAMTAFLSAYLVALTGRIRAYSTRISDK